MAASTSASSPTLTEASAAQVTSYTAPTPGHPSEQFEVDDTYTTLQAPSTTNANTDGQPPANEAGDELHYPQGAALYSTIAALIIVLIITGLDITIVAVAIPSLSNQFKTIADIGWYSTALRLVLCSFTFMFGKMYTVFHVKSLFLACMIIFAVGTAVSTFAVSSSMFIVGRAICGFGFAGVFTGVWALFTLTIPLRQRALYGGIGGGIEAVASVSAPLLGGVLIDRFSWRACFGLLLPFSAIAILMIFFLLPPLKAQHNVENLKMPLKEKLKQMDLLGTALFVPSITCLLLALQWAGTTYGWGDVRIVVLLVIFAVLLGVFGWWQYRAGEKATLPIRILGMRSILAGAWFASCCNSTLALVEYYMSIYFQGVRGWTAARAGIMSLPMIMGLTISTLLSGALTTAIGYYYPFFYGTTLLAPVAAGLLTSLDIDSSLAKLLCYQALLGFAIGLGLQGPQLAAQTVLSEQESTIGLAIVSFASQLGPVLFISASTTLFQNRLDAEISQLAPGTNITSLEHMGLSDIRTYIGGDRLRDVLLGYDKAVTQTLYLPLALTCLTVVATVAMERVSIKKKQS
ncbi:major facilitator superfamily domain-containing protein [Lipomyces kononenkoae]|uniref:Major facilitator superfamily domain-containing protein n=1 Tax=Lipomyces kononenkoae TaxID=34357 RepID=A0ACC3SQ96_LIPKO